MESRLGMGTAVTIYLPLAEMRVAATTHAQPGESPAKYGRTPAYKITPRSNTGGCSRTPWGSCRRVGGGEKGYQNGGEVVPCQGSSSE
jgi:hypothetical protein